MSSRRVEKEHGKRACLTHMHTHTCTHAHIHTDTSTRRPDPLRSKSEISLKCWCINLLHIIIISNDFSVGTSAIRPDTKHTITNQHGRSPFSTKSECPQLIIVRDTYIHRTLHTQTHTPTHMHTHTWRGQPDGHYVPVPLSITLLKALTCTRVCHSHLPW